LDFCFDWALNGTKLKILAILDECTRECLDLTIAASLTAKAVGRIMDELIERRGAPEFLRSDNGPEFVCKSLGRSLAARGCKSKFIQPGSPWENGHVESYNSRMRAEFLDAEVFANLADAQIKAALLAAVLQ